MLEKINISAENRLIEIKDAEMQKIQKIHQQAMQLSRMI